VIRIGSSISLTASEGFTQKNLHRSHAENVEAMRKQTALHLENGVEVPRIGDQETGMRLYAALPEHPDKAAFVDAARRHCAIIARFSRFPHRNRILARTNTPEEHEFLQQPGAALNLPPSVTLDHPRT